MRERTVTVLVLLLALVVAACGDGDGAGTTAEEGAGTTGEGAAGETPDLEGVELSLWGWSSSDAENAALNDLVASFSEETGANASFQPQAEYDVALQAALTSGDPPDVFYVDSLRLPDLADAGALAPVPEGAASNPDDIFPSLREAFTYDGTWSVFGPDCLSLLAERGENEDGTITREPLTMWAGGQEYPIEHIES